MKNFYSFPMLSYYVLQKKQDFTFKALSLVLKNLQEQYEAIGLYESMHWLLDVVFREDANKALNKTAAQNLNILRKLSLAILKNLDLDKKMSYRRKKFNINLRFKEIIEELFNL